MVCTVRNVVAVTHPGTHKIAVDISALVDSTDLSAEMLKNALVRTSDFLRVVLSQEVLAKKKADIWNVVFTIVNEKFIGIPKNELVELTTNITEDLLKTPDDQLESMFCSKVA